jgi:hypothetical protein
MQKRAGKPGDATTQLLLFRANGARKNNEPRK